MIASRVLLRHPDNLLKLARSVRTYRTPRNFGINFVPERQAWVIERLGKFHSVLKPGLNFCIPFVDRIAYVQSLKEIAIDIPDQAAITSDNVVLQLNGVLFLKVMDAYKASYGVEDAEFAITQLAQTTMRSEIGKIPLDNVFKEREALNYSIVRAISKASEPWGIECFRYEIRDIQLPSKIKDAMQMQVEAERRKRAAILESEGLRDAEINRAEGIKQSQILSSEGQLIETLNKAEGEAKAIMKLALSRAEAIKELSKAIAGKNGVDAVQMAIAERYIDAFSNLARTNNTMLLPSETGDVSSMVAKALTIFKAMDIDKPLSDPAPLNPHDADARAESYSEKPMEEQNDQKEQLKLMTREPVGNSTSSNNHNKNV